MIVFRGVVFTILSFYIAISPLFSQVLGYNSMFFRKWVMFSGAGETVCEVKFYHKDGEIETSIDMYASLGYASKKDAPRSLKRIQSRTQAMQIAERICGAYSFEKDIRMYARQGSRSHWQKFADGEKNICRRYQKK